MCKPRTLRCSVGDLQTPSENLRLSIKIGATTIPNDKRRSVYRSDHNSRVVGIAETVVSPLLPTSWSRRNYSLPFYLSRLLFSWRNERSASAESERRTHCS